MSTEIHNTLHLSIIIPAYNEAESLPVLWEQIELTLKTHAYNAEVIFINDGSTDNTPEVLDALAASAHLFPIHVIHFKRNQGKAEALTAGFAAATGDIVITMDADLQDDPGEIPKLLRHPSQRRLRCHFWLEIST